MLNLLYGLRRRLRSGAVAATVASAVAIASALSPITPAAAEDVVRGGVLRIAYPEAPDTLDPQAGVSLSAHQLTSMIYETLTVLDGKGLPQPRLATSWEPINGGREWTFKLREGVKFHDGREFEAADVVATVKRANDAKLALASKGGFGPVTDVIADGKFTVRFVLSTPFAELPVVLASPLKALIIPADHLDSLDKTPIGTGPFKFVSFSPGEGAEVARNAEYWDAGLPYLDGVKLQAIKEGVTQQASLRGGQSDIITMVAPETVLVLQKTPGVTVHTSPFGTYHSLVMQANMPPFTNVKVREAFKYILDRKTLVASALFGQGELGNDVTLPAASAYVGDLPVMSQDLAKAKALLDESGVGPLSLDLYTTSDRPPAPKFALSFAEAASKIGVKINVIDVPYAEYASKVARKMPLYTASMPVSPTVFDAIYRIYHSKGPMNYGASEQIPGLDAALDKMIGATDIAERTALAHQALTMLQGPSERLVPYFINALVASRDAVQALSLPVAYSVLDVTRVWVKP